MGLDGVEIVLELEDTFAIKIPDEDAEAVKTVGDLVALVRDLAGLPPELDDATFDKIAAIIADQLHFPEGLIRPDSRLVEDLGIG